MAKDTVPILSLDSGASSYGSLPENGLPKTPRAVNYDDILLELGEFGLWQKILSAIFWIPPLVGGAVFLLGSFTGPNIFEFLLSTKTNNREVFWSCTPVI